MEYLPIYEGFRKDEYM